MRSPLQNIKEMSKHMEFFFLETKGWPSLQHKQSGNNGPIRIINKRNFLKNLNHSIYVGLSGIVGICIFRECKELRW